MGLTLIWIESLAACLLLVALVTACSARLSGRWLRTLLPILVALVLALLGLALSVTGGYLMKQSRIHSWIFYYTSLWAVAFIVAGVIMLRRGLRRQGSGMASDQPPRTAARSWSRAKLAVATGAALLLCAITFWNMSLAARHKLAATRAEASALALSVAPSRPPDSQNAALAFPSWRN